MEEIARLGIGAGPDGDRQHHDVAGGEARDRQRPHQVAQAYRPSPSVVGIVEVGFEARVVQRGEQGGGASPRQATVTRRVERLTRARSTPGRPPSDALDPRDAGAAMDSGHAELVLPQAGRDLAACQQQFVA